MTPITLQVNGRAVCEHLEPRTHLADFLRDRLNLTGTHLRCEHGVCGACTLLVDGEPARSCITFAALCDGAEITTIEGLDDDPIIAALRRAFTAEHGLQCGFCTPAMLITARDIILRLPDADEARVRIELAGNLCRCTGYVGIVRAVLRAQEEFRRGDIVAPGQRQRPLGPVGARPALSTADDRAGDSVPSLRPAAANASAAPPADAGTDSAPQRSVSIRNAQVKPQAGALAQPGFISRIRALWGRVAGAPRR